MIETDKHPHLQKLFKIDYLVMDEADRMVELGHFNELDRIMDRVFELSKEKYKDDVVKKEDIENLKNNGIKPILFMK